MSIPNNKGYLWLSLFLLCYVAIPLDTLINYGTDFRQVAIDFSPNIFYVFGHAYWLESVFLLFYVRCLVYKNYHLTNRDKLFFVPFIFYFTYQIFDWFVLDTETKLAMLNGYSLAEESGYSYLINLVRELFRSYCGILCLIELHRYQKQIKNELSDIEPVDLTWLKTLVGGFFIVRVLAVIVTVGYISTVTLNVSVSYGEIGLVSNWFVLILLSFLIFYSLGRATVFQGIERVENKEGVKEISQENIERLLSYMEKEKPHLDHFLTLDKLSSHVGLSSRTLSNIINRHFKQNFFEFVNGYRIEQSKQLLLDPSLKNLTMLEVMDRSGFNSKATFNTFFKKLEQKTPTQFRKFQQIN